MNLVSECSEVKSVTTVWSLFTIVHYCVMVLHSKDSEPLAITFLLEVCRGGILLILEIMFVEGQKDSSCAV